MEDGACVDKEMFGRSQPDWRWVSSESWMRCSGGAASLWIAQAPGGLSGQPSLDAAAWWIGSRRLDAPAADAALLWLAHQPCNCYGTRLCKLHIP